MQLSAITELRAAQVYLDAGFRTLDISFCAAIYEGDMHDPILDGEDWLTRIDKGPSTTAPRSRCTVPMATRMPLFSRSVPTKRP